MISNEDLDEQINNIDSLYKKRLIDDFRLFHIRETKLIKDALQELKLRRESDIIPATKFLNMDMDAHINKVMEECDEVSEAADDEMNLYLEEGRTEDFKHLLEELVDVQFAAETAIAKILPNIQDRWAVRRQVKEKNAKRGYYEVTK